MKNLLTIFILLTVTTFLSASQEKKIDNKKRVLSDIVMVEEVTMDIFLDNEPAASHKSRNKSGKKLKTDDITSNILVLSDFEIIDTSVKKEKPKPKQKFIPKPLKTTKTKSVKLAINEKLIPNGKKIYSKECRLCHGFSRTFISKYSIDKWSEFLQDNGDKLKSVHAQSRVARFTNKYFASNKYYTQLDSLTSFTLKHSSRY